MHCDLGELKALLGLSFGHWEIFRLLINCLRDVEKLQPAIKLAEVDSVQPSFQRKKSVIEKQVSKWCTFVLSDTQCRTHSIVLPLRPFDITIHDFHSQKKKNNNFTQILGMQPRVHDYEYLQVKCHVKRQRNFTLVFFVWIFYFRFVDLLFARKPSTIVPRFVQFLFLFILAEPRIVPPNRMSSKMTDQLIHTSKFKNYFLPFDYAHILRRYQPPTKQVTLEEQMICGALQTLNEEAFEDVVASERPSPTGGPAGETIANDNNAQLQSKSQPQQQQLQQQQSQQPLTPIQETVELDRSSLAICTDRRQSQSSTQTITITANNLHKSHSNHSGLSLDDRQHSTHSLSAPSSLSQSPLPHSTPAILLTKSDERLNSSGNINSNRLTSSVSTVILMPNLCDDKSSKYDRTHL